MTLAIFTNVLDIDDNGLVTNTDVAHQRAAQWIRARCDPPLSDQPMSKASAQTAANTAIATPVARIALNRAKRFSVVWAWASVTSLWRSVKSVGAAREVAAVNATVPTGLGASNPLGPGRHNLSRLVRHEVMAQLALEDL